MLHESRAKGVNGAVGVSTEMMMVAERGTCQTWCGKGQEGSPGGGG